MTMNVIVIVIFCRNLIRTIEDKNKCNLVIVFFAREQERKRSKEKKGLMYTYLPQMHWLFFGGAFSITPLQQRLL
jgi:hypothetical protein